MNWEHNKTTHCSPAVIQLLPLPMTHYSDDTKSAVQQLGQGATLGMVDAALKKKGLGSGPRAEILEHAKRIINRRFRIKNTLIGAIGWLVVAAGGYWYYICTANGNHRVRTPTVVMMAGLLLSLFGVLNATRNKV